MFISLVSDLEQLTNTDLYKLGTQNDKEISLF